MKNERTKNAMRNMLFGGMLKLYQVIMPFAMRTIIIYTLGSEYAGLTGLFRSILQVLNLAELGVGSAMVFSMYRPIANNDTDTICALMRLYKIYYHLIGIVVAIIGCVITPFLPRLIKSDLPSGVNLYLLYGMNLCASIMSYWLFAYRSSILYAHQRTDISSKVVIITDTIKYIIQIAILLLLKNYYFYIFAILFTQIISSTWVALLSKKLFPQFEPHGRLEKHEVRELNRRIIDLFTSKLGVVIVGSVDAIVISAFLGLNSLAVYQNYFYPINAVMGMLTIVYQSCTAGIGNSIITESQEKNYKDFTRLLFITVWITCFSSTCILALIQPFMKLWVGEKLMLPFGIGICLTVYFFIYEINALLNLYKDAAGMWRKDRFRPLFTGIVNLGLNIMLVRCWGLYGIILSTVFSMLFVGMPWLLKNLFSELFDREYLGKFLATLLKYTLISLLICSFTTYLAHFCSENTIVEMLIRLVICIIVSNLLFVIIFHGSDEICYVLFLADKVKKNVKRFENER